MQYRNGDSVVIDGVIIGQQYDNGVLFYQIAIDDHMVISVPSKVVKPGNASNNSKIMDAKEYKPGRFK